MEMMLETTDIIPELLEKDLTELKSNIENGDLDVNQTDRNGRTFLHFAALRGEESRVRLLMLYGADLHARDRYGNTPLHWCGHEKIVEFLVHHGADIKAKNMLGATPADMARRRGVPDEVLKIYYRLEEKMCTTSLGTGHKCSSSTDLDLTELWFQFTEDLGVRNLTLLILGLLCLSLYAAYLVTGMADYLDKGNPVEVNHQHIEL